MQSEPTLTDRRLELRHSFTQVKPDEWNLLAGEENPFLSHAFFLALEESGCIGAGTSWLPSPALLRDSKGTLLAAAPVFIKLDSTGEYVFDYAWADAYQRLFGSAKPYYPKFQIAVPFTPVPGPRLLVHPELSTQAAEHARQTLLEGLTQEAFDRGYSSVHMTFAPESDVQLACQKLSYQHRLGEQYHWFNDSYESFDAFLDSLCSRKRKAIRRERRVAQGHPISFHTVLGHEATEAHWEALAAMYLKTARAKWGRPYLNLEFFRLLGRHLGPRVVLFLVRKEPNGAWIAGAWNLRGEKALFGRNWGCLESFDMLHFEVCYYRAIEYAIAQKLERVEAGAQGLHKIQRGYRPQAVHSAHLLTEPVFATLVNDFLVEERHQQRARLQALETLTPFRQERG